MSNKLDIVYVIKKSPINEELRYSLRSLRNFPHDKVWIYGYCPPWVKNASYVAVEQTGSKWQNTARMLEKIVDNPHISKDFVLMNDDFFILKPIKQINYYYEGNLTIRARRTESMRWGIKQKSTYGQHLSEADEWLKKHQYSNLNYEMHIPMKFNREKLKQSLQVLPNAGFSARRSLYGNMWNVGGENKPHDCKFYLKELLPMDIDNWNFVSTTDISFQNGNIGKYLRTKFRDKGDYEL